MWTRAHMLPPPPPTVQGCMREAGLKDVVTEEADHRHRVVFGHT